MLWARDVRRYVRRKRHLHVRGRVRAGRLRRGQLQRGRDDAAANSRDRGPRLRVWKQRLVRERHNVRRQPVRLADCGAERVANCRANNGNTDICADNVAHVADQCAIAITNI